MIHPVSLRVRIARLLLNGHATVNLILGMASILLAIGMSSLSDATHSHEYKKLLLSVAPMYLWIGAFYIYGVVKTIISMYRTSYTLKISTILVGLWLWAFIIVSVLLANSVALPVELIILSPLLCGLWDFAMTIYNHRSSINRRKLYDTNR